MAYFSALNYIVLELLAGEDFSVVINVKELENVDKNLLSDMVFTVRKSFYYDKDVHLFNVETKGNGSFLITYPASETIKMKTGRNVFDFFINLPIPKNDPNDPNEPQLYEMAKIAYGIIIVYPFVKKIGGATGPAGIPNF